MKKILMISYFFLPLLEVGSLRALGIAKYLTEYGWQPYVLSIKNPERSFSSSIEFKPPESTRTFYFATLFNLKGVTLKLERIIRMCLPFMAKGMSRRSFVQDLICIPDIFIGWILPCLLAGLQLIRRNRIDVIYVSCKPFSQAITGVFLKKLTKKPLVLDFRDPVSFPLGDFDNIISRHFTLPLIKMIERFTLKNCDGFIVTTNETKEMYLSLYPFLRNRIHRIYNGFYLEAKPSPKLKKFDRFTIVYTGNFYYNYKIPGDTFFRALQKTISDKIIPEDKIQFLYIGKLRNPRDWLTTASKKYGIENNVISTGEVTREDSVEILSRCSMLLLRIVPPMISTKLYEGLAVGIPILATIYDGEAKELIKQYSKAFYIIKPDDVDSVTKALTDAYHRWEKGDLKIVKNEGFLSSFNKKALTKQFVAIIEGLSY